MCAKARLLLAEHGPRCSQRSTKLSKCQEMVDVNEALFIQETGDWREPYLDYLQHRLLPPNRTDAAKVQKKYSRFFVNECTLFRRGLNQAFLRCIAGKEITTVLRKVYSRECGEHQGARGWLNKLCTSDILAYNGSWFIILRSKVKNLPNAQKQNPRHSTRVAQPDNPMANPHFGFRPHWTHQSSFSRKHLGPCRNACYTKWVEAITLKRVTGPAVANFNRDNIFRQFGVPKRILSDNDTPFINSYIREPCEEYRVGHVKSTPYYPQWNGQAEATDKTLLKTLSWTVYDEPKGWTDFIPLVLWAYRTSRWTSTQATPFSLVYGAEVVVSVEIVVPSGRLALASKVTNPQEGIHDVEGRRRKRKMVEDRWSTYQRRISRPYNRRVTSKPLKVGNLVLKAVEHIQKGVNASKFAPK